MTFIHHRSSLDNNNTARDGYLRPLMDSKTGVVVYTPFVSGGQECLSRLVVHPPEVVGLQSEREDCEKL